LKKFVKQVTLSQSDSVNISETMHKVSQNQNSLNIYNLNIP
jgi:hypothetical protein